MAGEQVVDQGRHVADVHTAVAVHVATQAGILRGEVARVAGASVDVGVGLVHTAGIVGRALAAHQTGAVIEHISGERHGSRAPAIAYIDGPKIAAAIEHVNHNVHIGRVETAQVKARQSIATIEHVTHIGHLAGV